MDKYIINGGKKLIGEVVVQSAKNSVLALLAASVMASGEVVLQNVPHITDVSNMRAILQSLGIESEFRGKDLFIDSQNASSYEISSRHAKEIRASIFLLGSVLGRFRHAVIPYPGGCNIGTRPIDLHLNGLKSLGVKITENEGYIFCDGKGMRGGRVEFSYPSVGATENIMMAAAIIEGTTTIINAAREPEIVDLAGFINALGGRVSGAGTDAIVVEGVRRLGGGSYLPVSDRIVAGTYLLAGIMTGGELTIITKPRLSEALISKLADNACKIVCFNDKIIVKSEGRINAIKKISTKPYPGFATDLQPQTMAAMCLADGVSVIEENLFETRLRHAEELVKMGADISLDGKRAIVRGVNRLFGTTVNAFDLRGGAAMVLAGLAATGKTTIKDIRHIDRGYENLEGVLTSLGGNITRVSE